MNNDLISREALKKYARTVFDKDLGRLRVVDVSDIDNAPTVKLDINDIEYKAYCKGLEDGKKIVRPQGKWLMTWEKGVFYCDKCQALIKQPTTMYDPVYNFCPNCGAKMKKGDAE